MVLAGTLRVSPIKVNDLFPIFKYWLSFCVVAVLRGESRVTGVVQFEQDSESSPTKVTYEITGMDPSANRGFHVQYTILPPQRH